MAYQWIVFIHYPSIKCIGFRKYNIILCRKYKHLIFKDLYSLSTNNQSVFRINFYIFTKSYILKGNDFTRLFLPYQRSKSVHLNEEHYFMIYL